MSFLAPKIGQTVFYYVTGHIDSGTGAVLRGRITEVIDDDRVQLEVIIQTKGRAEPHLVFAIRDRGQNGVRKPGSWDVVQ